MNWIIAALAVGLALAIGAVALSQSARTANVEVRVWQKVDDDRALYISARPEGGSWATLGTIPLPLDDGHSSSGRFRYGDITVAVPVASAMKDVEVRVWQDVNNARNIYISARPDGGSWRTLGTIPIPLTDGVSSSGSFRYGDITLAVELEDAVEPEATPSPTATPTPTPGPTYGSCSAAYAAGLTGHWSEEEARVLGLPLDRSDSDNDGVYCERRTRATATPTPTPSPTPASTPTQAPASVPTATPVVVTTPVPSYSQPPPSGGISTPTTRSTPAPTAAPTAAPTPSLAALEAALYQDYASLRSQMVARYQAAIPQLQRAYSILQECDAAAAALNAPHQWLEQAAMMKQCDALANSLRAALNAQTNLENGIAALDAGYQQTLAELRVAYQ